MVVMMGALSFGSLSAAHADECAGCGFGDDGGGGGYDGGGYGGSGGGPGGSGGGSGGSDQGPATTPDGSGTPDDPGTPPDPSSPDIPGAPADPTPDDPGTPSDPSTPDDPGTPSDPSAPSDPNVPNDPSSSPAPTTPPDAPGSPNNVIVRDPVTGNVLDHDGATVVAVPISVKGTDGNGHSYFVAGTKVTVNYAIDALVFGLHFSQCNVLPGKIIDCNDGNVKAVELG
ncbi:hypothetical protein [Subtercola lobariae]|nr:hypothetical protein [Subtercola lobariae]